MPILGVDVDSSGRCAHYHLDYDIAGLKCGECGQYYACYKCHEPSHSFTPCRRDELPVVCGACRRLMNFDEYKRGSCPSCMHAFNPKCALHEDIYFKT